MVLNAYRWKRAILGSAGGHMNSVEIVEWKYMFVEAAPHWHKNYAETFILHFPLLV